MNILAIIYMLAATTQIIAGFPQIARVIQCKSSRELSATTWSMWCFAQLASLVYTVSVGNLVLVTMSALWVIYYAVMVMVILYYRQAQYQPVPASNLLESDVAQ